MAHGNTVLRGGYGLYFGRITNGNILEVLFDTGSPLAQTAPTFFNAPTSSVAEGPQYPAIFANGASTSKPSSYFFSPTLKLPEVQEYDLQLQQAFGKQTFFSISYLGSMGRELPNFLNVNIVPCSASATACETKTITVSDASGKGPIPAGNLTINNIYTSYGNTALLGPNAVNYTSITEMISNVNSNYNAFVAEVQNHSLKSIQFDANYTWSHALDFNQNAHHGRHDQWLVRSVRPRPTQLRQFAIQHAQPLRRLRASTTFPASAPGTRSSGLINDWSIDDSFQMCSGLPYTAGVEWQDSAAPLAQRLQWQLEASQSFLATSAYNTLQIPAAYRG